MSRLIMGVTAAIPSPLVTLAWNLSPTTVVLSRATFKMVLFR